MAERTTRAPRTPRTPRTTRQRQSAAEPTAPAQPGPPAAPAAAAPTARRRPGAAERTVPAPPAAEGSADQGPPEVPPGGREATRSREVFAPPPVDIYEDDQGLVVVADLPGVEPGALDVRVEQGVLTLEGRTQPLEREHPAAPGVRADRVLPAVPAAGGDRRRAHRGGADAGRADAAPAAAAPVSPRRIEVRTA